MGNEAVVLDDDVGSRWSSYKSGPNFPLQFSLNHRFRQADPQTLLPLLRTHQFPQVNFVGECEN